MLYHEKTMIKGILRYCKDSTIETVQYSPSRSVPDEFDNGEWWRILTSLDPYMDSWGLFHRDPLQALAGKNIPYTCHVLDFEQLASSAKHIVFKRYYWNGPTWISADKKTIVCKYYAPACILEMEIEFVFSSKKVFQGTPITSIDRRLPAVAWAGVSELAKQIHDEKINAFRGKEFPSDLNPYALMAGGLDDAEAERKYPHCQKLVNLIKLYDDKIRGIAGAPRVGVPSQ